MESLCLPHDVHSVVVVSLLFLCVGVCGRGGGVICGFLA